MKNRKANRLKHYNYSQNGMYFVTICTKDRLELFGSVKNGKMALSEIGKMVEEEWLRTPIIRKNVILNECVIMPNHVHMIIEIASGRDALLPQGRDALQCVSTDITKYKNKFGPQINNLASIIRGFKGITTKRIHMCDSNFAWQPRFYDHIIRNETSLNKIREYIIKNPEMWERDRNNMENVWI